MPEKKEKIKYFKILSFYISGVVFIILFYFAIFDFNSLYFLADGIFPVSFTELIKEKSFFLWQENSLGFFRGIQIWQILIYFFHLFGINASNIQHILTLLLFLISYTTCFILLRYLKKNYFLILIFSIIYAINSITFDSLGAWVLMLFYSFMPLYIYFIIDFFRKHNNEKYNLTLNSFLFAVMLTIGSLGTIFLFFIYLFPVISILVLSFLFYYRAKINYLKFIKFVVYTSLTFFLLTLPFFINLYYVLFSKYNNLIANYKGTEFIFYFNFNSYQNYFHNNLFTFLLRPFIDLGDNIFIIFFYFFIILIIIYSLFFSKKIINENNDIIYFSKVFIIVFGGLFYFILHSSYGSWLFGKVLIFQGFMNPQKWSYAITVSCIIVVYILFNNIKKKFFINILSVVFLIVVIINPYVKNRNNILYSEIGGDYGKGHYFSKIIDTEILNISMFINKKRSNNQRVACFPEEPNTNKLCARIKNSLFYPSPNCEINDVISVSVENLDNLDNTLKFLNYRYIIIFKDVKQLGNIRFWKYGKMKQYIIGSPENFILVFNENKIIYESDNYVIFQLTN